MNRIRLFAIIKINDCSRVGKDAYVISIKNDSAIYGERGGVSGKDLDLRGTANQVQKGIGNEVQIADRPRLYCSRLSA